MLQRALEASIKPPPVTIETSAGPVDRKCKAAGDVAVLDKDCLESFGKNAEKSLVEITSTLQQLCVGVGELKKQSADSGKQLRALEARADEV